MLERVCRNGNPLSLLVGMQIDTTTMENSVEMSLKLGIKLPYDPTIPLLDIYPQVTVIQKDTYTLMFTAALFTRARTWKQPNMSINGWMDKEVVIHLVGFSSEISCLSGLHSSSTEKSWKGLTGSCSFKQWPTSCLLLLSWVHPLCGLPWCVVSSSPGLVQWHLEMWP